LEIFAGPLHPHADVLRAILIAVGVATALIGATMCVMQRHIKRLLAFSSISHVGMFICGVGLLDPRALAGVAAYIVGHGLTKGALFMCAGILLHRFAAIDEYDLHGRGREIRLVGVLFAVGGLLLAAMPPFTTFAGKSELEAAASGAGDGWLIAVFVLVSALTGGAVLRVCGRVFLGWGPSEGPDRGQKRAAREEEDELHDSRDATPVLMVLMPAALLLAAMGLALVPGVMPAIEDAAARFADHAAYARWVLHDASVRWPNVVHGHVSGDDVLYGAVSVTGALAVAWLGLFGRPLRRSLPAVAGDALDALRGLHSGHIGDYIAWWTAGTSLLGAVCLLTLT